MQLGPGVKYFLSAADTSLAARIRAGEHSAFRELVDCYLDSAIRLGHSFLKSTDAAHDCAHSVFARLWIHREQFLPEQSIKSYVLSAVRNQALHDIRYGARHPDSNTRKTLDVHDVHVLAESSEEWVINRMTAEAILSRLSEKKRLAVQLRFMEQLSHLEIAEVMGISRSAVERLINRAIEELRRGRQEE